MKRSIFCILLLGAVAGLLFTQHRNPWGGPDPRWQADPPETLKVTGKLAVLNGMIALQDTDTLYYVRGLDRFIGFIEGLKEGATVSLEGYSQASPSGELRFLRATKLTLNTKQYDLVPPEPWRSQGRLTVPYPPPRPRFHHRGY
ncbi:MAG: hypothetical protein LBC51_03675 [Treponema sp.]|jgi:hypothetical protein|nr:hypothetical protein [Treponema sp.]